MKNYKIQLLAFLPFLLIACKTTSQSDLPTASQVGAAALPEQIAPLKGIPFDMPQLKKNSFPCGFGSFSVRF